MANAPAKRRAAWMWGVAVTMWLQIWFDRRWPGSPDYHLAFYANMLLSLGWMGYLSWTGYRRRRPFWTRESWRLYRQLAWMPVAALVVFMALVFAFDARPSLFGAHESATRLSFIAVDLTLMLFGVVGVVMAIGWLTDGEPSEPFTRTRWFRRRRTSAIAD